MNLEALNPAELRTLQDDLSAQLRTLAGNGLSLNLTRGKPCSAQLALSDDLEHQINGNFHSADGTDTRNYGGLRGIRECRELGAALLNVDADRVIASGNSSLTLMHLVVTALQQGAWWPDSAWDANAKVLTPVPGYDRHFNLCERLGLGMVPIPLGDTGPDMTAAAELAAADPDIKGIWCVPKYSNPTGCVYDAATVTAMAALPQVAAAENFVVFWDNAYAVHDLYPPGRTLESIAAAAAQAGTSDHIVQFASTSKVTFAGAGIGFVSASERVLAALEDLMSVFTIGPDKVNQLRHARFLNHRLDAHMAAHADILRPKFELVEQALTVGLDGWDIATWTRPEGGYFVSLDTAPGMARAVIAKAQESGLALTRAGATYPYGRDPEDRNVRLAPTFAELEELESAMQVFLLCLKLTATKQRIAV